MRSEIIDYLGEEFEINGFYMMPTQNRDTGERFGASFEIDEVIWLMDGEANISIYVDVMPTMSAEVIEEIERLVISKIEDDEKGN